MKRQKMCLSLLICFTMLVSLIFPAFADVNGVNGQSIQIAAAHSPNNDKGHGNDNGHNNGQGNDNGNDKDHGNDNGHGNGQGNDNGNDKDHGNDSGHNNGHDNGQCNDKSGGQNGTTLSATVNGSGTVGHAYKWNITKTVTPAHWDLFPGDTGTSRYTITVTKDKGTDEKCINGQVSVTNGGSVATEGLAINVTLNAPPSKTVLAETTVDTSAHPVLAAGETYTYAYQLTYPDLSAEHIYKVTADVTITNHSGSLGNAKGPSPSGDVVVTGKSGETNNDSINVDDSNGKTWTFNQSGQMTYDQTFTSADAGVNRNMATIRETGQTAEAAVTVNTYNLAVTTDSRTSYTRNYNWTITKSADQSSLTLSKGQQALINYVVGLSAAFTDQAWQTNGTINIHNPAPVNATINSIADIISPDIKAAVTGASFPCTLKAGETLKLNYSANLPDAATRTNTATATLQNYKYDYQKTAADNGTTNFTGANNITFSNAVITEHDKTVNVTDDKFSTLGAVTYSNNIAPFHYSLTVGPYDTAGSYQYTNTATFVASDTGATGSDSCLVTVTVPDSAVIVPGGGDDDHHDGNNDDNNNNNNNNGDNGNDSGNNGGDNGNNNNGDNGNSGDNNNGSDNGNNSGDNGSNDGGNDQQSNQENNSVLPDLPFTGGNPLPYVCFGSAITGLGLMLKRRHK